MTNFVVGAFFLILTAITILMIPLLPSVISSNPTYIFLAGFFAFLFAMLGIIVILKD